jgi:hypothetical protein
MLGGGVLFAPLHALVRHQLGDLEPSPRLTGTDWPDTIDPAPWRTTRDGFAGPRPVIGRHGQASADAWPKDPDTLLAAYPDDPRIVVRLLGAGPPLRDVIRPFPRNWDVLADDGIDRERFLGSLDFFVYTHDRARLTPVDPAILEALASGVVAILPPAFEPIFGDAAVYATPDRIQAKVRELYADRAA